MLWTVYELANRLAISPEWIWAAVRRGELPHYRFGRFSIRFDPEEIEAWCDQQYHQSRVDSVEPVNPDQQRGNSKPFLTIDAYDDLGIPKPPPAEVPSAEGPADEGTEVAERQPNLRRQPFTSVWRQ